MRVSDTSAFSPSSSVNSFPNSRRPARLSPSSQGAETTRSQGPGDASRRKSPNRINGPFFASIFFMNSYNAVRSIIGTHQFSRRGHHVLRVLSPRRPAETVAKARHPFSHGRPGIDMFGLDFVF